jgi:endonuclease III
MRQASLKLTDILTKLEKFHGKQEPCWPLDPYEFIVWWHCGYPASDVRCTKGLKKLSTEIGIEPEKLLSATPAKLASALKPGGMFPELRGLRLKEIAMRVKVQFDGDLRTALAKSASEARKILKKFPGIADPGADRILLFSGIAPVAAVPSNCAHVLARILDGKEQENYARTYRRLQEAISTEIAEKFDPRMRAYLLVKRHGQETCKRTKPKCDACPVNSVCAYFAANRGSSGRRS